MSRRDWASIDAAIEELDKLIDSVNLPGNHPDTLRDIERCLGAIEAPNVQGETPFLPLSFYPGSQRSVDMPKS